MPRTPDNLVRHELIGLQVTVVDTTGSGRETTGTVVDETRNTLVVADETEETQIPKAEHDFRFELGDEQIAISGSLLVGRPAERILKKFPRKWEYTD